MSHELDSILILIHPPLAILGYIFTFIAFKKIMDIVILKKRSNVTEKDLKISLTIAWWLTFAGLITGMIWAQLAWGTFWSWDPKETATLVVFVTLTIVYIMNLKKVPLKVQAAFLGINILSILGTISVSFLDLGLHSFG